MRRFLLIWAALRFGLGESCLNVDHYIRGDLGTKRSHGPFLAQPPLRMRWRYAPFLLVTATC
jgi:hypothetical protein